MWRVVEKIPGPKQLEALFLIFLTLGSIKQNNTDPHLETERIWLLCTDFPFSGCFFVFFRVLFIHGAYLWMCVLFYFFLVCLFVYTYDSKSIARVPSCRELHGHPGPITAHQSYFSGGLAMWWVLKQTNKQTPVIILLLSTSNYYAQMNKQTSSVPRPLIVPEHSKTGFLAKIWEWQGIFFGWLRKKFEEIQSYALAIEKTQTFSCNVETRTSCSDLVFESNYIS